MSSSYSSNTIVSSLSFTILCLALLLVSFIGLFIPIMEVDAAQYASMSMEMLQNNSFLTVTDLGEAYLDKPPLLFWLSSLSINLLGNTSFAFKLPSFLLAWASVYFLYRLVKIYYDTTIAQLSVLLYAGSVAFVLFTNDIRTDTLMISFVVLAVWQFAAYIEQAKTKNLLVGSIAVGFAMLAKGPIGAVIPFLALAPHLLLKGKLPRILDWRVLLIPFIILLVLSPMLIGLYEQWGVHGIRFYFWEQSFGRITGENVWKNEATYFYFLHNIAWAFLPFILFLVIGLLRQISGFKSQREYLSLFGFILPFIALSFSQYKLPHYIYVVVPFAAIIASKEIKYWWNHASQAIDIAIYVIQLIIVLALSALPLLLFNIFEVNSIYYILYILFSAFTCYLFYKHKFSKESILYTSFFTFVFCTFFLNAFAYPNLLKYQASSEAGMYVHEQQLDLDNLYQLNIWWRGFHYYAGKTVPEFHDELYQADKETLVYTDQEGLDYLASKYELVELQQFPHFNVTRLSIPFLNPNTRANYLSYHYLIKIK